MHKQICNIFAAAALACTLMAGSGFAQTTDKMADDHMSGKKMTHQAMMDKMNAMSTEDKAAMFDKMTEKDKMAAMKMAGHDMSKMHGTERMDHMSKMSADDKAAAFDKMPMEKKMTMMKGDAMMPKKMDKMDH